MSPFCQTMSQDGSNDISTVPGSARIQEELMHEWGSLGFVLEFFRL